MEILSNLLHKAISISEENDIMFQKKKNQQTVEDEIFILAWMMRCKDNDVKRALFERQSKRGTLTLFFF